MRGECPRGEREPELDRLGDLDLDRCRDDERELRFRLGGVGDFDAERDGERSRLLSNDRLRRPPRSARRAGLRLRLKRSRMGLLLRDRFWVELESLTGTLPFDLFCKLTDLSASRLLISSAFSAISNCGIPSLVDCASIKRVQSLSINSRARFPSKKPVKLICMFLPSGKRDSSNWLITYSYTTSSSKPRLNVICFWIHGLITSILIFLISIFWFKTSLNFNCFNSFLYLSENRLSWSALVPRKNPASVMFTGVQLSQSTLSIAISIRVQLENSFVYKRKAFETENKNKLTRVKLIWLTNQVHIRFGLKSCD